MSKKTVELVSDILGAKASFIDVANAGNSVGEGEALQATAAAASAAQALGAVISKTVGKAAPATYLLSVAADGHSIFKYLNENGKIKNETALGAVSARRAVLNDERRGLIYSMRVKMDKASINVDGTPVSLSPGMAVSVEIKTGKRRVIEYFLSPLMQHADESLRER